MRRLNDHYFWMRNSSGGGDVMVDDVVVGRNPLVEYDDVDL